MKSKIRIGVIGAGASGMMAAIAAAENGAEVTVLEKNDRVGQKILVTGNGKCNISNLDFNVEKYYCDDKNKLHDVFCIYSLWDTLAFFSSCGMMTRNKNGYLYPYSEQASTVLDIFRRKLAVLNMNVIVNAEVEKAEFDKNKEEFTVICREGSYCFDKIIIACGGPASQKKGQGMTGYQIAESFGHTIFPVVPALVQLKASDSFLKALAGVRIQAEISLYSDHEKLASQQGELQFTDYGISGIPVFQFSRVASYELAAGKTVTARVNFLPDYEKRAFLYEMRLRFENQQGDTLEEFFLGTVHKKIISVLIKQAGYRPGDKISDISWEKLKEILKLYRGLEIHIYAPNSMENAQVCAGGVRFSEITREMESLKQKGLYFAGEVIDVDGYCGGYNLQWAWSSGYIAGRNAAGNSTKDMIQNKEEWKGIPC